jgi:hypothetical protein
MRYTANRMGGRRLTLLSVCVVVLLAVGACAPAAGRATGGEDPGLPPTDLTAVASPAVVTYHDRCVISGSISLSLARLTLLARRSGDVEWVTLGTVVAGGQGVFRFTLSPLTTTDYRVSYSGDGDHAAAEVTLRVSVRPRVTVDFPASLWLGQTARLRGTVAPAHRDQTVQIERLLDGVWSLVGSADLDSGSRFSFAWKPAGYGFFRLRARINADIDHAGGASVARRVIVNRPNEHRVPFRFGHYIVIVVHEYRLYYYEHGERMRAFDVALGRPGYATPIGLFRVYAKRKPAGGALGACAMYYHRPGGIAIHGTNEPRLLSLFPRDFSHGCARMYNAQALWLYHRCPLGTPVHNLR